MPRRRSRPSSSWSLSRIVVAVGAQRKEVARNALQDQLLEVPQIVEAEVSGLPHRGLEGLARIGPLQFQQALQGAYGPAMAALLQRPRVRFEFGMMLEELRFDARRAVRPGRGGMVRGLGMPRIALADQARVGRDLHAAMMDVDRGRILVHRNRLTDETLGH